VAGAGGRAGWPEAGNRADERGVVVYSAGSRKNGPWFPSRRWHNLPGRPVLGCWCSSALVSSGRYTASPTGDFGYLAGGTLDEELLRERLMRNPRHGTLSIWSTCPRPAPC